MKEKEELKQEEREAVEDLEVTNQQATETKAGIKLKPVYITSYQTGGAPGGDPIS